MSIPAPYDIDFSIYEKDLVQQALSRMLGQFYDKCVFRQFVTAFVAESQELYDTIIDMQRQRTVYNARSINLDALGRIVGADRLGFEYDDGTWFKVDTSGQSVDQLPAWVRNAPMGTYQPADDDQYRLNIIVKAIKNHTLTASVPELTNLIELVMGIPVSFRKVGPNKVQVYVPADITSTQLFLVKKVVNTKIADDIFFLPFPVTLTLDPHVIVIPRNFFKFDTKGRGFDNGSPGI